VKIWAALVLALMVGTATKSFAATVGFIEIKGAIGPATATYIARAIDVAAKRNNACLIIQLDTPGGLLDSTRDIVQKFYASPIPTVVYVAPSGANAGSAGTFITMAADVAAMAPNTSIGAAHPVQLTPGAGAEKVDDVMKQKMENTAVKDIQAIAEKRGRNAEWAKSAVRESASITSEEALELKVIDVIAKDLPDLLQQIDGRKINDKELKTAGANVIPIPRAPREKLFQLLWRPEVMFVLMLIAMYGIIGEVSNPGAILPGVAGAIAFILFLYMSTILPINIAGLALILLAIGLFIIDVYSPTHGVLTSGGIIAFFLGALMLFDRAEPDFRLSFAYIIPATVMTALFFVFIVGAGLRAQRLPVKAGAEAMIGKTVQIISRADAHRVKVFVEGEYWNAESDTPIDPGQSAQIIGIEGLTLKVKPKNQ